MKWKLLLKRTTIVLIAFLLYKYSKYFWAYLVFGKETWTSWPDVIPLSIMLASAIILACAAKYLINQKITWSNFGLHYKDLLNGFIAALIFVLPQAIGLGFYSHWDFQLSGELVYRDFVLAGFGEEFIFRAFLFGLLFYYAGWGFLSAGLLAGLFFGWGHLYQADSIGSAIGIFLFTCGASVGFSWFYYAWNSLWMVLFLHFLMDLTWDGFQVDSNVTGNLWINIARFSTLGIAIIYTVQKAKKEGRYDLKSKLWINSQTLEN